MNDQTALLAALVDRLGGGVSVSLSEIDYIRGACLEIWRDPTDDTIKVAIYRERDQASH